MLGFPTAVIAGPIWGKYISKKIYLEPPFEFQKPSEVTDPANYPPFRMIAIIISIPLLLILVNTFTALAVSKKSFPNRSYRFT
jgi:Gnt-I system low-affinity gluconate transporter